MLSDADRLILLLARGERRAVGEDRRIVVPRLLEADFSRETGTVREWDERPGAKIEGTRHPLTGKALAGADVLASDTAHLAKRIADGDWPAGTTFRDYMDDLRRGLAVPNVELHVGFRNDIASVAAICRVEDLPKRTLVQGDGYLFIVYNARSRCLSTGYWIEAGRREQSVKRWRPRQEIPKLQGGS